MGWIFASFGFGGDQVESDWMDEARGGVIWDGVTGDTYQSDYLAHWYDFQLST